MFNALTHLRSSLVKRKAAAYRWWFRNIGSRRAYPIVNGRKLRTLREAVLPQLEYKESVCNAGLLSTENGYISVAKNQRFTLAHELVRHAARHQPPVDIGDDPKLLYCLRFDSQWQLRTCKRLNVIVDGRLATASDGVEDVRLFHFADSVWAYATGSGNRRSAWPLMGNLGEQDLRLRSVVAPYAPPQKNWMPFILDGSIYLEHSIRPHIVLRYDHDTSHCDLPYHSDLEDPRLAGLELHGGAPPVRLDDRLFLGVGNSQRRFWYQERYYAPVFYLFEATPPFRITKFSPPVRLLSRRERIQYVCGMTLSPDHQTLTLSYGISDHDNCFVAVPLSVVLKLLGADGSIN
jgi:hypothetical protein